MFCKTFHLFFHTLKVHYITLCIDKYALLNTFLDFLVVLNTENLVSYLSLLYEPKNPYSFEIQHLPNNSFL